MKTFEKALQALMVGALSAALPSVSLANITNTATVTYYDSGNTNYNASSNQVVIVTPPVITSALTLTGNTGVAITPYQISGTNGATSFGATGLPNGLSVNGSGQIVGTPTQSGTFNATISATNTAGAGTATLVITIIGSANITLVKSADVTTAKPGDTVTFSIAYTNTTAGAASTVVITDVIPSGTTLVPGSITSGGVNAGGTITWNLNTVSGNTNGTVSFKVTVN